MNIKNKGEYIRMLTCSFLDLFYLFLLNWHHQIHRTEAQLLCFSPTTSPNLRQMAHACLPAFKWESAAAKLRHLTRQSRQEAD